MTESGHNLRMRMIICPSTDENPKTGNGKDAENEDHVVIDAELSDHLLTGAERGTQCDGVRDEITFCRGGA